MPVLLCAGKGTKGGCWEAAPDQGTQAQADDGGAGAAGEGPARPAAGGFAGAICPVTITANEVRVCEGKDYFMRVFVAACYGRSYLMLS